MTYCAAIGTVVNPAIRPGLDALDWWLADHHYSQHARESIVAHAAAEGTPTGSPYLEAEDEASATDAFVGSLPAVPFDSIEWGPDGDRSVPADAAIVPPELDPEEEETGEFPPPPGADPGAPYEPTPADWEDYRRWSLRVEARRLGVALPPIAGGGPDPAGPTEEEKAEALEHCRWLDRLAELRAAEDRAPLYGWE